MRPSSLLRCRNLRSFTCWRDSAERRVTRHGSGNCSTRFALHCEYANALPTDPLHWPEIQARSSAHARIENCAKGHFSRAYLRMTKVGFVSLGCPKNLVDSEVMMGILARDGYELTPRAGEAEVLVVNTCSFIEAAQKESVDAILEMAEHKKSGLAKKL